MSSLSLSPFLVLLKLSLVGLPFDDTGAAVTVIVLILFLRFVLLRLVEL